MNKIEKKKKERIDDFMIYSPIKIRLRRMRKKNQAVQVAVAEVVAR